MLEFTATAMMINIPAFVFLLLPPLPHESQKVWVILRPR